DRHRAAGRPMARLVLTATNGDSWVLVRAGGLQRFQGTITQGHQLAFTRRPNLYRSIWFAASKPQNLVAKLNGRIVVIPGAAQGKPEQLVATSKTIQRASSASGRAPGRSASSRVAGPSAVTGRP